jgi:hypothetical protein
MYAALGRPSIPPEQQLRAQLLQMRNTVRSERLLMEEMDYNLLFLVCGAERGWRARTRPDSLRIAIGCCKPRSQGVSGPGGDKRAPKA